MTLAVAHEPTSPTLASDALPAVALPTRPRTIQFAEPTDRLVAPVTAAAPSPFRGASWRAGQRRYEVVADLLPAADESQTGDFCVVDSSDDALTVVLGDVVGHGPEAAVQARELERAGEAALAESSDPLALLRALNAELWPDHTASAVVLQVIADSREARWASAGHPAPLFLDSGLELSGQGHGALLGALPEPNAPVNRVRLAPNQGLLLFTDGLLDARPGRDERFGSERLSHFLRELRGASASVTVEELARCVRHFCAHRLCDDTAVVALRRMA
ncbi:MAG: serine/threonine-protein phosphatase [Solirubrobacterales bacterium]|nr:serine/threonine-protein phosphatase [Solirubrobacterales bacterium]